MLCPMASFHHIEFACNLFVADLGSPVGLEAFEGYLYFLSENNGTLIQMPMFNPRSYTRLITGFPRTNDLKLYHRSKAPSKG